VERLRRAIEEGDDFFLFRIAGGTVAAALAIANTAVNGLATSSFLLFGISVIAFAFPWQRLSALKAGPIEFALAQEQVRGAVEAIELDGPEKERIERTLARLGPDLEQARGSRVLWVDDKPPRLLGERRVLRALEIETVIARTCREAARLLARDNDFDLLITSVVKSHERNSIKDGSGPTVLFIRWLRGETSDGIDELLGGEKLKAEDPALHNLNVIVYAALSVAEIWERVRPVAGLQPPIDVCEQFDDLLVKAITTLADLRANPLTVPIGKEAYIFPRSSLDEDSLG
jgi:CheY-like chemotaxis protein